MSVESTIPAALQASVIVPARNEEACLAACLRSLSEQAGVSFEIIVVDDASTDRTGEIAKSFPQVRVVHPPALPPGWSGKVNAVEAGAAQARGAWLLFTDADTVHLPGSLARAITEAEKRHAALLSYSPEQQVRSFWEKAVMPVVFAELASSFNRWKSAIRGPPSQQRTGSTSDIPRDLCGSRRLCSRLPRRCSKMSPWRGQ